MTAEQAVQVPPLSTPELPDGAPDQVRITDQALAASDAVTLFVERARAVCPDFALTPANGTAVARICRRLDGIPLALELAAVRLRSMSAEQILERLDDRFRLLARGNRAAASRHQTLQALIDWSYELCTAAEQALWQRTSVFSGGFELAAAEQVCAGDDIMSEDVLDLMDALVDKSILSAERNGHLRYRMLESIRQYASDRLTATGQQVVLQRRHRDYFEQVAGAAHSHWFGPDQVAWQARLRREDANMRTALEFCLAEPGQAQHALTIADDVWLYFHGGHVSEGRRWYERSLALATEPTAARAAALWANGLMAINQIDFPAARHLLGESRALAEALGDRQNHATAETWSGWLAMNEGDLPRATTHLERALAEHLALHDTTAAALDQQFMAKVVLESGDAARAVPLFEQSRDASQAQGNLWLWSWALIQLGRAAWQLGDRQRARELIVEGLRLKVQLDDRLATGYSLELLAWVTATDDPERAARLLGEAQGVLQAVGATGLPYLHADHQEFTAHLRATLGEQTLTALFDRGAALTFDEAVADALRDETARSKGAEARQARKRRRCPGPHRRTFHRSPGANSRSRR